MIDPISVVHTAIRIQSPEDRTGRGGDHQPFRQHIFTAMRLLLLMNTAMQMFRIQLITIDNTLLVIP